MELVSIDYQNVVDLFVVIFSYAAPIGAFLAVVSRVLKFLMDIISGEERVKL